MSGVTLLREPLGMDDDSHVIRIPRYVRPSDAEGYWHVPRSAAYHDSGLYRLTLWCGPRRLVPFRMLTNNAPEALRCGTCEGRADGFAQRDGLIFRPRDHFTLPRLCPSFCRGWKVPCHVCGGDARYRRNYCHYDEVRHKPGPLLSEYEPCPRHGWRDMRECSDRVVRCRDWRPLGEQCDYVLTRRAP